jgi:hypothetical protein
MEDSPMSNTITKTRTFWRVLDACFIDADPDCDVVALTMQLEGGDAYTVAISGPKGMKSDGFVPAVRAAAETLLVAIGGAITLATDDGLFDTGDQRAN